MTDDQIDTIWHLKVGTPATIAVRIFAHALLDASREELKQAFQLGQDYWRLADSDSPKQQSRAEETQAKFEALLKRHG